MVLCEANASTQRYDEECYKPSFITIKGRYGENIVVKKKMVHIISERLSPQSVIALAATAIGTINIDNRT